MSTYGVTSTTMEKLLFWTLGYGGWLGVALLPMVWSMDGPKSIKTMITFLVPPAVAMLVTGFFYSVYGFAYVTNNVSSIMISPAFLKSSVAIVCMSLASIGLYMTQNTEFKLNGADVGDSETEEDSSVSSVDSDETEESMVEEMDLEHVGDSESSYSVSRSSRSSKSSRKTSTSRVWVSNTTDSTESMNTNTDILRNAEPLSE